MTIHDEQNPERGPSPSPPPEDRSASRPSSAPPPQGRAAGGRDSTPRREAPGPPQGWSRETTTHQNGAIEFRDTRSVKVPESSEPLVLVVVGRKGPSPRNVLSWGCSALECHWQVEREDVLLGGGYPDPRSWEACAREASIFAGGVLIGLQEATP